ncbi:hypothetical protein M4I21_00195 [Cellulophaga sp. 20_2_10]|uniref:hypothetical protein n=1 Tax=Cellulophaga sp. 20_2_10 TaxID=2942476 RepID=UPI00201A4AD9|nr:hypothetical protein [Cellulophaga sp. 20_2_10]MCL5244208.1 hypothetical protein [Cellulophaga sp. 20_2_10]
MNIVTPFKKSVLVTTLCILLFVVLSCSSDDNSKDEEEGPRGNCIENGALTTVVGNHGHALDVTKQDIINGTTKTYNLEGSAGHMHMLTITTENFTSLKTNNAITIATSTNAGHAHAITIGCTE